MFGNDVTFTGFLSWFTPRMFDSDVAFTGFLSWFTPRMFDYGVAFTGFPRVVYSPILFSVLHSPVVFTWFAPRVISNGIRILNVDSDLGLLFRKWRGVDLQRPPGPLWFWGRVVGEVSACLWSPKPRLRRRPLRGQGRPPIWPVSQARPGRRGSCWWEPCLTPRWLCEGGSPRLLLLWGKMWRGGGCPLCLRSIVRRRLCSALKWRSTSRGGRKGAASRFQTRSQGRRGSFSWMRGSGRSVSQSL